MPAIPCTIVRGGSSKGVFVLEDHLPSDPARRDNALVALMGSPDPRQIDGLGGADPLTSKVVIVSRATRPDCDVEYESVEVALGERFVNHGIMCGNLTAGVAHFAALEGLIPAHAVSGAVRLYCRNTAKFIVSSAQGTAGTTSELHGAVATISLKFEDPAGAVTGKLLPLGEPQSLIEVESGRSLEVTVVDSGTLYAFVRASDVGVSGAESAPELDNVTEFRRLMELVRVRVADSINERMPEAERLANKLSPRRVKLAIVAPAGGATDKDLLARVINPAKVHKAYAVSGAICLGSAASIEGSLVRELTQRTATPTRIRIGHPTGVLPVVVHFSEGPGGGRIDGAEVQRSIRVLLRGEAYFAEESW
jgi:2-methylaconitate cis-trans-isomerase PrpF